MVRLRFIALSISASLFSFAAALAAGPCVERARIVLRAAEGLENHRSPSISA
jgi:hypothetical protein